MAQKADPIIERRIRSCTSAEEFWGLLLEVVPLNSRAYLGTLLKQAAPILRQGTLRLPDERLGRYLASATPIDAAKVVDFLLQHPTSATYYEVFCHLKHHADDRRMLYSYCQRLLQEGSDLSYNMASVLSLYFDLQLPATFALRLQPYQLSRLDEGYEAFRKIMLNV